MPLTKEELYRRRKERDLKNRDRILFMRSLWRKRNADKIAETSRKSWVKHRHSRLARKKAYYQNNKDRIAAANKLWKSKNQNKVRQIKANWKKRNAAKAHAATLIRRAKIARVTFDDSASKFCLMVKSRPSVSCEYCGKVMRGSDCDLDHIVPISRGGPHTASNLCISCPTCNRKKGTKTRDEFRSEFLLKERMGN